MSMARRAVLAGLACAGLGACTSPADELPASLETLRALRERAVPPLAVGAFTPASKEVGRSITIRLSVMHAPKGSNYAEFLGQTFATELKAAGTLDPASPLVVEGMLTESRASEDFAKGGASLGATITLRRAGAVVLQKPYRVETKWKSDFIGAIAIPDAFMQYNSLYALLVRQVLTDPEFLAAAKQ